MLARSGNSKTKTLLLSFGKSSRKSKMRSNKNTERLVRNKHCKSLFNSITNPLNSDHVSTRKFKIIKEQTKIKPIEKEECKFQKSQYRNKLKEKETLEKSLEIEKHFKVQENLKALHEYIKRLRVTQNEDMSITRRKSSKSERQTHRKSTSSKRNRREHNRSRLYENAQKLFEYQNPSKNQSIDAKLDKTASKHIKYTTLLSKDKKLKIVDKVEKSKQEESKSKKLKNNKYYSAPVSTKENGLVTKFKFNNTAKIEPEKQAPQKSGNVSQASEIDISHDVSQSSKYKRKQEKRKSEDTDHSKIKEELPNDMPKNEEIQKMFSSEVGNSPSQKVIQVSVINSTDNFEEDKRDIYRREHRYGDIIKDDQSDSFPKQSNSSSNKPESAKAAVPILDFTGLPKNDRNGSKSENISHEMQDHEIKSSSIGSIFDHDSHMDLSSKRLKKLILTSDFSSLLNLREEALKYKETKERNKISKMLKNSKISPRTSKNKEFELEKWITNEKAEIKKTKKIIEEARKRTEDVLKEAQINTDFMKQILTDKVMTPREGVSVRSSLNSSRRQYEQKQKEVYDDSKLSLHSDNEHDSLSQKHSEKYFKKEIMYDPNNDKSDIDGLVSVDTPQIISDGNSSFNNTKKIKFDPNLLKEKLSDESDEPKIDKNMPINLDIRLKDKSSNNSDSSGPSLLHQNDLSGQSLSRKKSEQHLKDLKSKLSSNDGDSSDLKLTVTPTPQTKPSLINPFNSDNFFTRDFDDQEMEAAIEQLKNSSGKMYNPKIKSEDERLLNDKTKILKKPAGFEDDQESHSKNEVPSSDHSGSNGESSDDSNLKDKIRTNKMVKVKDSRNTEIKESKNNEQIVSEQNKDDGQPVYGDSDVDALRIKTTNKPDTSDSRNEQKRAHEQIVKSNNTNESIKEDIILEKISDKADSENDDKIEDDKNITGEQSLNEAGDVTPSKAISVNDSDLESEDRTDPNANSDSKYATVSILSEMSKKAKEVNDDTQTTVSSKASQDQIEHGNKLIELIYEAMLSEIKSELFPQRPLFLLTADLEKIELEQALIYLNDMSVEKEAALLKEYLKYSEEDALNSWELDNRHERDSNDSNMFSDSGKLVLYERKGISTDLFSIERYVDELATEVDDKCKPKFLTDTFTPIKKDSMAMLNQLQNSDIGSYDHFETDLNSIAILPLEVYLELEKKRKSKENEESKSDYMGYEKEDIGSKSSKASKTKQKEKNLLKE